MGDHESGCNMDYEYEIFDYMDTRYAVFPQILPQAGTVHTVYVDRSRFDIDVAVGQEKMFMAYAQFQKDVSRCGFHMNGRAMRRLPHNLPASLVRYCTQAVLGLPVEIMHFSGHLVAELVEKQAMKVFASDRDVTVTKCLRCKDIDAGTEWSYFEVVVWVSVLDPTASISYRFDDDIGRYDRRAIGPRRSGRAP